MTLRINSVGMKNMVMLGAELIFKNFFTSFFFTVNENKIFDNCLACHINYIKWFLVV